MARRRNNTSSPAKSPPKEQVVQIIVSDTVSGGVSEPVFINSDANEVITRNEEQSSSFSIGRLGDELANAPVGQTDEEKPKRRVKKKISNAIQSNYQTRQKSGIIKRTPQLLGTVANVTSKYENSLKRKRGRARRTPSSLKLSKENVVSFKINSIDCSDAVEPSGTGKDFFCDRKSDDDLTAKLKLILADANDSGSREKSLKARVLLEQIQNYKAKAFKFSVDTAIEYTKWNELSSKSYEFVRTLYGEGLFTLPSVKTIRRYVDPYSESVLLTNLEAAQSTLQQLQEQGEDEEGNVFIVESDNFNR